MAEPASSGVVGLAGWKLIGGAAGIATSSAILVTVVVMLMTWPKTVREMAVGIISTVLFSLAGGSYVILHFNLTRFFDGAVLLESYFLLMCGGGIVFLCGLPGWIVVRALFAWFDKRQHMDISELVADIHDSVLEIVKKRSEQ